MLKFGYKASAEQFGPRDLLSFAVAAESNGFDSVMVSDHLQPWRHTGGHAPFAFAWLAAAGASTQRIELGTSVVTPTFRYNPVVVAQAMATLACLFPSRIMLGVGTGESMNEVPALGIEWPDSKERFARLKESIELMQRLWREEFVTHEGTFYRTRAATIYDRPDDPLPVYIAASGPAAARLAGRVADGFICTSGKGPELYTETLLPSLAEGLAAADRPVDAVERLIEMKVSFDHDRGRALEDTREWAALALSGDQKMGIDDPRELEILADQLPIEKVASRWLVSDDPEEHVEQVRPYIEMGFTHLVFHGPGLDQIGFIERYGREILPLLRQRFG